LPLFSTSVFSSRPQLPEAAFFWPILFALALLFFASFMCSLVAAAPLVTTRRVKKQGKSIFEDRALPRIGFIERTGFWRLTLGLLSFYFCRPSLYCILVCHVHFFFFGWH
jgi:hypothetical protein